ncbi:MAG TPA: polysaccharide biosynthesis tyrosine autokinase [Tepidisphaeraceae bacterium]|jgi:capsular exopolysaccharide synthesis family protein|nr:polysaccharide biosynthesis tyrosine autokinase [Tepidisphaeraceae bacterium]
MSFLSRKTSGEHAAGRRGAEAHMVDAGEGAAAEITPKSLLAIAWRRKLTVLGCVAAAIVGGMFYLKNATPLYTGYSQIYVERNTPRITAAADGAAVLGSDENYVYVQTTLLTSTPVIADAVAQLDTGSMVTFADATDPVQYLKSNLAVEVGKRDGTITVSLDSPVPAEATEIVEKVVGSYSARVSAEYKNTASEVLKVLEAKRDQQNDALTQARKELAEFRKAHPTLSFVAADNRGGGHIVYQRLADLQRQLTLAQIALADAREAQETAQHIPSARAAVAAAEAKMNQLQVEFDKAKAAATALNSEEAEHSELLADIAQRETLLASLEARIREVDLTKSGDPINIRVLEKAYASSKPTKPEETKVLALAGLLGLLLGGALAGIREYADDRLRSTDDIIGALGMPVLGMIPHMTGRQSPAIRGRKVQREFMSDVAEAYRTLRTSIYFGTRNEPIKTLLITSPTQGDGKSTTASNLAIAIAQAGRRTLIVDTDFRRPQLHKIFEIKDEIGLSSVLAGRETLDKAIHSTGVKGLEILPCGPIPSNPSEILNSEAFNKLLNTLGTRYDLVVLDSPPVSPVTDARILGAICDATLLVLKSEKNTRKGASLAADALHSVGARVLGVICNGVMKAKGSDQYYSGMGYGVIRPNYRTGGHTGDARQLPAAQMSDS